MPAALALSLAANLLLAPLLASEYLRFTYRETIAHWVSKAIPPPVVYLGDSLTAGGRMFNSSRTINLAQSGQLTYQIAAGLPKAHAYRPRHIAIMAGTNDAIRGDIDRAEFTALWAEIARTPNVVITLAPHTRSPKVNARIDQINAIANAAARAQRRPVIDLHELDGPAGTIQPRYTVDGVHLSPAGHRLWNAKLRAAGL